MVARVQTALYIGDAAAVWAPIEASWRAVAGSHLLRMQVIRVEARYLRARAALLVAQRGTDPRRYLAIAARDANRIARERMPWCTPIAALLRGSMAHAEGRKAAAIAALEDARGGFDRAGMALYAAVTRQCLGRVIDGGTGVEHAQRAESWMAEQGVVNPSRLARLIAPGFG